MPTTTSTPSLLASMPCLQHGVGLADTSRRTEEDLELATLQAFFVALNLVEQFVGVRAVHLVRRLQVVEGKIELEHVHARFAEDTELAAARLALNERVDVIVRELARACHAIDLIGGGGGADLGDRAHCPRTSPDRPERVPCWPDRRRAAH